MSKLRLGPLAVAALVSFLFAGPAAARLVGVLEEPVAGGSCAGVGNVRGWVYSTDGSELVQPFQVLVDGQKSIEVSCCSSRGDVTARFEDAPARTGFSGTLNFQLLPPGSHTVSVVARSRSGESLTLQSSCISRRIGSDTLLTRLDLDNDGAGYCETDLLDPQLVCCSGVRTVGPSGPQICENVCYRWERAAQGMVMSAGSILAHPLCRAAN